MKPKSKAVLLPIAVLYVFLQKKSRVCVWLYEVTNMRIEGRIDGFDEYMNIVLVDACEVYIKSGAKKQLGRILLKGDCITLIQSVDQ
ncbi:hypothetical protein Ciccas_006752 [Cichlidogyrus casuarinus]|uniref:Small nuclear ribonucleoprotein E n=1 Tax=Cichlidogyrus casuarinus TaxID=1844966 RepID=A0ABD2Q4V9_9PLAT